MAPFEHFTVNFSKSYPFKGARAGSVCLFWLDSSRSHWVNAEWDSMSTESTRSETPRQLSQRRIHQHIRRFYHSALTLLTWSLTPWWRTPTFTKILSFRVDSVDVESHSMLTQLTWSLTWHWLSLRGMRVNWITAECKKIWISQRIREQNRKNSKALLFGLYVFDKCKKREQKNLMQVYL